MPRTILNPENTLTTCLLLAAIRLVACAALHTDPTERSRWIWGDMHGIPLGRN